MWHVIKNSPTISQIPWLFQVYKIPTIPGFPGLWVPCHRRSRVTSRLLWRHNAERIVCCCLLHTGYGYGAHLTMHCQWRWLSRFSFLSLATLTFDLDIRPPARFLTMHLTAKFHRRTFNHSEFIVWTNQKTNWQTKWQTRMWANAQRDGRPAKHRWHPLFNAAKFGWRPLLDAVQ